MRTVPVVLVRFRARRGQLESFNLNVKRVARLSCETWLKPRPLAVTVLFVPNSLDIGA